ncbi:MAG: hypothetical protein B6242_14240 [Anaerolineaceae bacterium 4572_78]|nr:MAG: hypothetical protein B6242_14240 [Anaerolineaceae bacterium 4572_78]
MDRRKFFKWLITTLATATSGYGGYHYAFNIEPYNVGIEHIQIPIKHLPSGLDGFKIVQISDIHLYPAINIAHVHHVFNMANKLKPDVILLTGDYVTDIGQAIFELVPALDSLNARYGVFAIHGNHDLWAGRKVSVTGFWETNVSLLVNENVVFDVNSTQLAIAGVDDTWAGNPSLDMALDNISPNTTTILMAHEPDFADVTANDGRVHLQLSGHSHGGHYTKLTICGFIQVEVWVWFYLRFVLTALPKLVKSRWFVITILKTL